jgi:hypothetical protein
MSNNALGLPFVSHRMRRVRSRVHNPRRRFSQPYRDARVDCGVNYKPANQRSAAI